MPRRTIAKYIVPMLLVPVLVGFVGMVLGLASSARTDTSPPPFDGFVPAPPPFDATKRTAVVIAANSGTEGSDFLAPYEVLARSGAFNIYAVAPQRKITHLFPGTPLARGVDIVPHFSFAEYDATISRNPDVIVIPFLPFEQAAEYQTIMQWIRDHSGSDTLLVSICAGAKNLADTGLLDGHRATTHHYTFAQIEQSHPNVELVRGVRYVEDGNLITSAGVTAGVDASLFVLKRLLGDAAALAVAEQLDYPYAHFLDDPSFVPPATALADTVSMVPPVMNAFLSGFSTSKSELGVALYEGISELALASVVDTYPHQTALTVNTVAPERAVVLSRHGLALVPRWSFADTPALDRLIVPGELDGERLAAFADWASERQQPMIEQIHQDGEYVYTTTFNDMAHRFGREVANQAVYVLEYPLGRVSQEAPLLPFGLIVRISLLALLGLGLGALWNRRGVMPAR
jgi:transcriptional regulator GlxA family with amidase domain